MIIITILISVFLLLSPPLVIVHSQESTDGTAGVSRAEEPSAKKLNLNFDNIDIRQVLKLIALKGEVNIVAGPDVAADVSINLRDVTWHEALDIILAAYGYGYDVIGNAIVVEPIEKLREKRQAAKDLTDIQQAVTEVFALKYLDANDAKAVLEPQLSPRGKVTVLQETSRGWGFAGGDDDTKKREQKTSSKIRSDKLVVTDIPSYLDKIRKVVGDLDVKPKQVLIEARIMEVDKDLIRDIGFDWGTGATGAESSAITTVGMDQDRIGGNILSSQVSPSSFGPKTTAISGAYPYNTGMSILLKKLSGAQFEVIFHALEENVKTNVLSAPHILTLDGREATILVGTKYPILKANTTGTDTTTVTSTLDYYQDIGIQLNVIPKIATDNSINMVIHPAVTDFSETLKARGSANQIIAEYPIIHTREAETNVFINNGETIVIGGLLKDVEKHADESVPLLGKIPVLGYFFTRHTKDREKVDLLLFITAHIIENDQQLTGIVGESSEISDGKFKDDSSR